jgi:hypothetical protein
LRVLSSVHTNGLISAFRAAEHIVKFAKANEI